MNSYFHSNSDLTRNIQLLMPIYLIDKMKNETERGNYAIFVEFEKVFDKIDHNKS